MNLPAKNNLLQSIKDKISAEEFSEVANIVQKNVVALGTDEAFALRDSDGEIKAYKQRVVLSQKDGTLIQPVPGGPFVISAQGYEVLSEATGTCVIFPKEVVVNGHPQMNPFVERDTDNNRVLAVYARAIAFRFSSKGVPQVADWSTIFDTPSYRMIDLLAKAKKFPQAFRLLPVDMEPGEDGTWAKYNFDESTKLWINTQHEEALQWFSQIINREKKAIDFAQTFARRNAVKHLLGLQKAPGNVWDIPILCWRPVSGNIVKWDATQYSQLQDKVNSMIESPAKFKTPQRPQITNGKERVSDETGFDALESEIDPEDQPTDITPQAEETKPSGAKRDNPEPEKPDYTEEEKAILSNLGYVELNFPAEYANACKTLKLTGKSHTLEEAEKIMKEVNRILDGQYE